MLNRQFITNDMGSEEKHELPDDIHQEGPAWSGEIQAGKLEEVTFQQGTERKLRADRREQQHMQRPCEKTTKGPFSSVAGRQWQVQEGMQARLGKGRGLPSKGMGATGGLWAGVISGCCGES